MLEFARILVNSGTSDLRCISVASLLAHVPLFHPCFVGHDHEKKQRGSVEALGWRSQPGPS